MGAVDDLIEDTNAALRRRQEYIDHWITLALQKRKPRRWVRQTIRDALHRLAKGVYDDTHIEAARRELLAIRNDIISGIGGAGDAEPDD